LYCFECNYALLPFKQTVTDSTILLDVCNRIDANNAIIAVTAQLIRQNQLDPADTFELNKASNNRLFSNFQYLDTGYLGEIDELIKISDNINKTLRQIANNEYFSIQKEEVKDVSDFSMVMKNLIELENMINEL
jgi:hypothetical protein